MTAVANDVFVLVADADEVDRQVMANLLTTHGYRVMQAIDGSSALKVLEDYEVDVAVIGHHMSPLDGFSVAKHIRTQGDSIGIVMTTDQPTTDLLLKAAEFGIGHVIEKPVDAMRLTGVVKSMTRKKQVKRGALKATERPSYSHEELMQRAIALSAQNAKSVTGGPFGAVVANKDGQLMGEGVNGVTARCDPSAHAEVLAIKRAAEYSGSPWLHGYRIYTSAEPTMLAQALIISTGISEVYYGLSHSDVNPARSNDQDILREIAKPIHDRLIPHVQLCYTEAKGVFEAWQNQHERIDD